ncbi:MAG: hypothetical protein ACK5KP_06445 [Paludibacteraceae bacterium]
MKTTISLFAIVIGFFLSGSLQAQVTIGSNAEPNTNALLDLKNASNENASTKGLLLPRVALTSTTAFTPLTAHVAGMSVYNTATTSDVTPGYYYNDGSKWVRIANATPYVEPWNISGTTNKASANTENVYMTGNVAIGTSESNSNKLLIKENATTDNLSVLKIQSLISSGSYRWINIFNNMGAGSYTNLAKAGDFGLIFSVDNAPTTFSPTKGFLFAPHMNGYSSGMKFFDNGAVSVNSATANEMFNVNGNVRITYLPISGTDSIHNGFGGENGKPTTMTAKFTGTRTLVADASGNIGSIAGIITDTEPWYVSNTVNHATSNTQSIYQTGSVGIGTNNPLGKIHVYSENGKDAIFSMASNTANEKMDIDIYRLRGTDSAPAFVQSGDNLGGIRFNGLTGTSLGSVPPFATSAKIDVEVDGASTTTSAPGRLNFHTTASGSSTPSIRMVIKNDGFVGIGTTTPVNLLHVTATTNPLRLDGLVGGLATDSVLTVDAAGVVRKKTMSSVASASTSSIRKASGNVLSTDYTILGTGNVTLPSPSGVIGKMYNFVYDGISFTVNGSLRFDGNVITDYTINNTGSLKRLTVQSDGTNWVILH